MNRTSQGSFNRSATLILALRPGKTPLLGSRWCFFKGCEAMGVNSWCESRVFMCLLKSRSKGSD